MLPLLEQLISKLSPLEEQADPTTWSHELRVAWVEEQQATLIQLGPLAALARDLLLGPAPRASLLNLHKLVTATPVGPWPQTKQALQATALILSSGPELTRLLVQHPTTRLAVLLDPSLGRPWSIEELDHGLDQRLLGCTEATQFAERLVRFRNDQYIRLAACEFGLSTLAQVGEELANLADVCLERAVAFVIEQLARVHGPPVFREHEGAPLSPCRLCAVAMGKYGAQELNFCSDIDIVFLYSSDEGHAGELSLNEFFAKVCQQVTRILAEPTTEGFAFRVDLRLRPEGSRGPICNSVAGAERYYETWGGPYDRLAWLKARSAAGDLSLGHQLLAFLRPFIFPRSIHFDVVQEIQALYQRIRSEQRRQQQAFPGWNVKLDAGGIREVEFFVQALQLVHAGKQVALQERSTLGALDKLLFAGLISEQEHRQLGESYELWRRLEHRLQLHQGRQTHLLPEQGSLREQVIHHLGFTVEEFTKQLSRCRVQVSAIYATLGLSPDEVVDEETAVLALLLDPELESEVAAEIMSRAGFVQVDRAVELLQLLVSKPHSPLGRSLVSTGSSLGRILLGELSASPDPDAALRHLTDLVLRLGPSEGFWKMLAHHRPALRVLCSLFGSSDFLARLGIRQPELLVQLLLKEASPPQRTRTEMSEELAMRLSACAPQGDLEERLSEFHRYRTEEVFRIGSHDIAGGLALDEVWLQLSHLAELILEQLYPLILNSATSRYGQPRGADGQVATMSIIGLGKLGGQELTYASDLDLIFIYSTGGNTDGARSIDNGEFFARVAQRLIRVLTATLAEGSLYQIDTRLRPSGRQGMLVSSWPAWQAYHQTAQIWERQVLIKARCVGGDRQLGHQIEQWVHGYVYDGTLTADALRQEIHRLRQRMEAELAEESTAFVNLKLGRGGLLDIEFIAQYFQLCHGREHPELHTRSTLQALQVLAKLGHLSADVAGLLDRGYRFLRRLESRLRIVRDRSAERLPATAEGLEVMARRLGYRPQPKISAGEQLLHQYQEETATIRQLYDSIFG